MTTRPHLHKKTVNLTGRSDAALEEAARLSGDNQTDTINRAIQIYAFALRAREGGGAILVQERSEHGSLTQTLLEIL